MGRISRFADRVPTRVRVTIAFAAIMALLLAGAGLFLYLRLGSTLQATVDRGLRSRAGVVSALIQQADSGLAQSGRSPLTEQGESLAQILDSRGRVVDALPTLREQPLLNAGEVRHAVRGTILVEHARSPVGHDPVRLLATPVSAQGHRLLVVVGSSLDPVTEAQSQLGQLLIVGGPIALLIASLAGYGAAAGALRPVELMRRRAREIQATRPGRRLPVPPAKDEVARLGETLNEMLDRLEEAFAHERRFVSDASHELRTPLAILKAELELAVRDATDIETMRAAVASAADEADRVVALAEDLLVIARSDDGRLPVRLAAVDAGDVVHALRRRFASRAGERGVDLEIRDPEGRHLVADRLRLEQALGNLVDNALRHGSGTVTLAVEPRGDRTEVHVRDDGPGFPEDFVADAFERFTRADTARGRGGAGLGLAIVAAIARGHGGSAHARNRPEGGADVWIELPEARAGVPRAPA
jgi:two-component system OmpR family sensor kinase